VDGSTSIPDSNPRGSSENDQQEEINTNPNNTTTDSLLRHSTRNFSKDNSINANNCEEDGTPIIQIHEFLPEPQRSLFLYFVDILLDVIRNSEVNKMTTKNIGEDLIRESWREERREREEKERGEDTSNNRKSEL